jgi:hypothetical protein
VYWGDCDSAVIAVRATLSPPWGFLIVVSTHGLRRFAALVPAGIQKTGEHLSFAALRASRMDECVRLYETAPRSARTTVSSTPLRGRRRPLFRDLSSRSEKALYLLCYPKVTLTGFAGSFHTRGCGATLQNLQTSENLRAVESDPGSESVFPQK